MIPRDLPQNARVIVYAPFLAHRFCYATVKHNFDHEQHYRFTHLVVDEFLCSFRCTRKAKIKPSKNSSSLFHITLR